MLYGFLGVLLSLLGTNPRQVECMRKDEIYVTSNGIHLNIIIPVHLLDESRLTGWRVEEGVKYLGFGWGDKGFYLETPTWSDLRANVAFKALFLNTESAVHVVRYQRFADHWLAIPLCDAQLDNLLAYIYRTFEEDHLGRVIEIKGAGYTKADRFYEARGTYTFLKTCNNWVNTALKEAEVKTSVWSPFDFGVVYHIRRNNASALATD